MAKRFNNKSKTKTQGFGRKTQTLSKCSNNPSNNKNNKKRRHVDTSPPEDNDLSRRHHPSEVDDVSEEESDYATEDDEEVEEGEEEEEDEEEEFRLEKEPSDYDKLLEKLKSSRHLREAKRKKSGKKDESEGGRKEDDNAGEGSEMDVVVVASRSRNDKEVSGGDTALDDEDDGDDIDDEDSDVDDGLDGDNLVSASISQSNFGLHITRKLLDEDRDNLLKRGWKYKWEIPALDSPHWKWMGTGECFFKDADVIETAPYGLKLKLYKHWLEVYTNAGGNSFQSSKQRFFFSLFNSYRDMLHHNKKPFYQKGSDDLSVMDAYLMHSLNHVFRTRDLITKHDAKLGKDPESAEKELMTSDSFQDQGFTRPKVLILLPIASIAFRVVRRLIQLTPASNKANVEYMNRFNDKFGVMDEEKEDELDPTNLKLQKPTKPADWEALFGANNNDNFMVGIKYTKKSIRLYSDFYSSDMIVASPLGLMEEIVKADKNKEKDVDYLSSIEVLIVDHADVIAMQTWSHVKTVVEYLNRLPSGKQTSNIFRVRPWYLEGHAQFYRQTIILSSYLNPDINAFFNRDCLNFEGKLRLSCEFKGVLPKVMLQVRQVYERFDSDSIIELEDARFDYFVKKVFPKIKDSIQGGIMLLLNNEFDFYPLRRFLTSQNASFCLIKEDSKQSDISRARNWFYKGERKIMLYSERMHFYRRYKIRGIQNIIIYSLPERKEFYPEVLNMLEGSHNMTCTVLFSRFDLLRLERIVGSSAAKRMTTSDKDVFIFC